MKKDWKKEAKEWEEEWKEIQDELRGYKNTTHLFCVIVTIFLLSAFICGIGWDEAHNQERELGQAICDHQYNMDLDYYGEVCENNQCQNKLFCKPKKEIETGKYDGIEVSLS